MANDWIKIKTGITTQVPFIRLCQMTGMSDADAFFRMYKLASWFREHGKHGKIKAFAAQSDPTSLIDAFLDTPGFAFALEQLGWLKHDNGNLLLRGFCTVSSTRKCLSAKLRKEILSSGACAVCGDSSELVVDHKTPVSRGGLCVRENLHALCARCNRKKGTKTMEEFLCDRGT